MRGEIVSVPLKTQKRKYLLRIDRKPCCRLHCSFFLHVFFCIPFYLYLYLSLSISVALAIAKSMVSKMTTMRFFIVETCKNFLQTFTIVRKSNLFDLFVDLHGILGSAVACTPTQAHRQINAIVECCKNSRIVLFSFVALHRHHNHHHHQPYLRNNNKNMGPVVCVWCVCVCVGFVFNISSFIHFSRFSSKLSSSCSLLLTNGWRRICYCCYVPHLLAALMFFFIL